jgi:hypothetical protein
VILIKRFTKEKGGLGLMMVGKGELQLLKEIK